ncbi:hypothetical protein GQ53DRAFT_717788 [Thozetella sp. PMI_491]|nr:hypothetical protein GQ53DRAFT_717788 [Thozetella sp. PMI_491]
MSPSAHTETIPNPIHPSFIPQLDADFVEYYNKHLGTKKATHAVSLSDIRANSAKFANPWARDFSDLHFVKDIKIASEDGYEFTARCYHPDPSTSPFGEGPYPVYINFHGGGYTLGDLTGDAQLCMLVRNRVGVMAMDVDYRLCPEHPMLKGHDDAWATVKWVYEHGKTINARGDSISVGGISAGGTISAVVAQLARDAGIPLKLAFLGVPNTESHMWISRPEESSYQSMVSNALAPCLNWARIEFFMKHYQPKTPEELWALQARPAFYLNPIRGNLEGLCTTFIATASADPLCDEGEAYGEKLIKAGVLTTVRRYTGVPHPFMHMSPVKKAVMYEDDMCNAIKLAHGA